MDKRQLIVTWVMVLLLSGCISIKDKSIKNDSSAVRVSGDLTASAIDRKGF